MGDGVPPRAVGLVKAFVHFHERLQYYLLVLEQQEMELLQPTQWIAQLCAPTDEDVVRVLEDRVDVYTHPSFIRLLYRDDTYRDLREHNICLLDALEVQCPRGVVQEFFNHLHKLSAENRARSFLSLASKVPSDGVDGDEDEERIAWLDRIADSFTSSPRALRPQLLLAASIIGHTPMVAQVLRDLGTDDEQAPNIDAVEAECLIEAATNQHFLVVKELLDGGRFSNRNETRWDAVVQALEVSCTNGCADITDILLSHYLSYCSVISACGAHHLRLLRLALANWHFEIVELLLECDPRGTLCNVMELIDTLREEIAQASQDSAEASSGLVAIIVGEENDDMGDLVMWDAAALARGVSSENTTLVRFLVNHVDFCPETLTAALEAAEDTENLDMVQVISNQLMKVTNHCRQEEIGDEMAGSSPSVNLIYSDEKPLETWAVEDNRIQSDAYEDDARDGACTKHANHDEEYNVKAVSHTILPSQPAMMDAVRTASFKEVGCVISAATHSVVMRKVEAASQADLVRASTEPEDKAGSALKLESNALPGPEQNDDSSSCEELTPKLEDGTLAESEQCARTSPNKELTLLRQFSSNTVDEMVCEGKLAAVRRMDRQSDIVVEEQTEIADGSVAPSMVEKNTNESEVTGSDPSTETITIDVSCNNTVHFSKECVNPGDPLVLQTANPDEENEDYQYEDENERKTVYGTEDIMVDESIMPTTSDTESTGESTDSGIASCSNLAKENFLESGHCSNPDSEKPVSAMTPLSVVTTVHNLVDTTVENFKALGTSDSEQRERTQVISEICYNVVACTDYHETKAVLPPQVLGTSSRTPAASPNRSTIICPVKWEHIADVSESSVRTEVVSVPLHEGDRVEVHYKGRSVLFPGVIAFCHSNGVYDVVYEDGEEETCVSRDLIQLVESYNPKNSGLQNDGADENEVATLGAPVSVSMSIHCSRSSLGSGDFGLEVDGYCETAAHADVVCRTDQDEREDNNEEGSDKSDAIIAANEDKRDFDSQPEQVHVEIEKAISIGHFEPVRTDTLEDPGPNSETTQSGSNHFEVRAAVKEDVIKIEHLPEIPSLTVPSSCGTGKNIIEEIRLASGTSKRSLQDRSLSITSHRSRCRTADNVSAEEVAEWKNVDLLLNRKRRLFQSQTGSVETTKVPWGEEFATIQSLKRFAAQHPDILRAHM
ncbi:unnamed protein product [Phytophthora lilii]|uniref:Unnamed protein product n=1 Tax=Phytophthora lilii TaxID=2077276 RepID=A0A9W6TL95_9STRA|nr:unnamed protein product [Phytophthora lilii]